MGHRPFVPKLRFWCTGVMASYDLPERRYPELLPDCVKEMSSIRKGAVALFDADGTLWRDDVADDFTSWMIETQKIPGDRWERYLEIYRDDHAAGCRYLLTLYRGLTRGELHHEIWTWWREHARRQWIIEALEALYFLAEGGCDIWIVTGSPSDTMFPLRDFLPVHQVVGMDFAFDDQEMVTGDHDGISCADDGKADKVRSMLGGSRQVIFAAGNGSLDRAMMEIATDVAWAVYPNPEFEATARARGWPVLERPPDFVEESKLA